ncbi:MAG: hypothetical protein K0R94_314 [Burkholderiales bacterium]|jgi:hypothetical protein|nr:hypothetical protein [Burkholderiales bacterium]
MKVKFNFFKLSKILQGMIIATSILLHLNLAYAADWNINWQVQNLSGESISNLTAEMCGGGDCNIIHVDKLDHEQPSKVSKGGYSWSTTNVWSLKFVRNGRWYVVGSKRDIPMEFGQWKHEGVQQYAKCSITSGDVDTGRPALVIIYPANNLHRYGRIAIIPPDSGACFNDDNVNSQFAIVPLGEFY